MDILVVKYDPKISIKDLKVERSGKNVVVLRNISHDSAGRYKCEVLAERPSFEKDAVINHMEVIVMSSNTHQLTVAVTVLTRNIVEYIAIWPEDQLTQEGRNCTSSLARPPSQLVWYINGDKISPQHTRLVTPEARLRSSAMGLGVIEDGRGGLSQTSELTLVLRPTHFNPGGQATLTCAATVPDVYHMTTEVYLALPGFKTAAPSQKLYGSARRHGGRVTHLMAATFSLLVLLLL
nr:uncharacterized protein LOC128686548 [Cherax quadricarinatus]